MIGFLRGQIFSASEDGVIVDCNGVGYDVFCTSGTLESLRGTIGKPGFLWIYTQIKEDGWNLFGFETQFEKSVFMSLIKVNGVGPKVALAALSGASADRVLEMIETEDVKALTQLPKIGKKIAEQIILSLKGKLVRAPKEDDGGQKVPVRRELSSALINLGFRSQDVERVVAEIPVTSTIEEGLKLGLKHLTSI